MTRPRLPRAAVRADVVGVVPVPAGEDSWLVSVTDLDGEPLVVHAVRAVLQVAAQVVVLAPGSAVAGLRQNLDDAGLPQVRTGATEDPRAAGESGRGGGDLAAAVGRALGGSLPVGCVALLVHDPLCPLAPAAHLSDVLDELALPGGGYRAGAAVHPMTDTVKAVHADAEGFAVAGTVDRERLRVVTTPVLVPVDAAGSVAAVDDGPTLVAELRRHGEVGLVTAPPIARRVHDRAGLHLVLGLREVEEHRGRRPAPH
jgi:2-C-methyl-D-erythritol 4-phosphate cytidylyltransferase